MYWKKKYRKSVNYCDLKVFKEINWSLIILIQDIIPLEVALGLNLIKSGLYL